MDDPETRKLRQASVRSDQRFSAPQIDLFASFCILLDRSPDRIHEFVHGWFWHSAGITVAAVCHPLRHLDELARHLDELGKEIVGPLGRRLGFLAPLLAQGFGLRHGFLEPRDVGFQSLHPLGRRLGFLAPSLAQNFGLRHCFFQGSDMGFQGLNPTAFVWVWAIARCMPDLPCFLIGKDASLEGLGKIWTGQPRYSLRVT